MIFENSHGINLRDSGLMMCRFNFYSLALVGARNLMNHRQSLWLTQAHLHFDFFFLLMVMQIVIFRGMDTNCLALPFLSCVVLLDTNYPTSQEKQLQKSTIFVLGNCIVLFCNIQIQKNSCLWKKKSQLKL